MPLSVMLLVLLGAALHATWNALVKAGADRYLDTVALVIGAGLVTLCCLPFLPLPARSSWSYLAASAVIHQAYFILIALSYRKGDMSLVYPLTRGTAPALTALFSATVLKEHPSLGGWNGVFLISSGVILLAFDTRRSASFHPAPIFLALTNAGMIVLYTLLDGVGARRSGHAFSYTCWDFLFCALLFTPTALAVRGREVTLHLRQHWSRGLLGGACSIAAYSLALWAMTRAPIASVAALRETSILFGALIAAFTLKERVTPIRFAAVLLIAAGALVIKLF